VTRGLMRGLCSCAAATVAAAVALAGCGGSSVQRPPGGAALFSQNCSKCHSLIGNESLHREGGDLAGYELSPTVLAQFSREMPVRRPLRADQLTAIVAYVYAAERAAR